MAVELVDVASGLWVWRLEHPAWHEGYDWEPLVTSTVVESGGEVALIDPLAPPEDATEIWDRLDASPPTMAVILKPDHVRDVDLFVGVASALFSLVKAAAVTCAIMKPEFSPGSGVRNAGSMLVRGLVICSMRRSEMPPSVASAIATWSAAIARGCP